MPVQDISRKPGSRRRRISFAKERGGRYIPVMHTLLFTHIRLAFLLILLAATFGGCAGGGNADPYSKRYTAGDINPNPAILNNSIVKGTNLSGLHLENVRIKDATFYNTTAQGAVFKNVVFDNCRFINAKFDGAVLDNVIFLGGILTCENDPYNFEQRTVFTNSRFTSLILDGVYLENPVFSGSNSSIVIRNCLQILATHPLVTGENIHLVLENSYFRYMTVAEVTGASTLTATGCRFEYAFFGNSAFAKTLFSKNIVDSRSLYDQKPGERVLGNGNPGAPSP